jgi:serine protease inhibitor
MSKLKEKILRLSLVFMVLAGCNNPAQSDANSFSKKNFPPLTSSDPQISTDSKIVAANNKFGFKLFSELLKKDSGKNIFISPPSISFALSMTYNGANGTTKEDMAKALEIKDLSLEEANKENNALIRTLINLDDQVKLDIANSLWGRKGIEFNPTFIKNNQDFYKAEVASLDFASPEAAKTINQWVSDNTQKKIEKIVDDKIDPSTLLFLINAIYFKGSWTEKFDKTLTKDRTFTLSDGKTKQHPMMERSSEDFKYYKGDTFQAVSLPYGKEKMSMYVFLPNKESNLTTFYKNLTAENWQKWMNQFSKKQGQVVLPKFKLEYESSLNDALKALGMATAFDMEKADFKNMFAKSIQAYISEVKHKTFVDVNEEGTEAAAVTSVEVRATSAMPGQPFQFVADHPFFYAIRDSQTGTVLFMGTVTEPKV